jgi:hypothetical protein
MTRLPPIGWFGEVAEQRWLLRMQPDRFLDRLEGGTVRPFFRGGPWFAPGAVESGIDHRQFWMRVRPWSSHRSPVLYGRLVPAPDGSELIFRVENWRKWLLLLVPVIVLILCALAVTQSPAQGSLEAWVGLVLALAATAAVGIAAVFFWRSHARKMLKRLDDLTADRRTLIGDAEPAGGD